jgi:lipopolysaccharide export system protein LptA
MKNSHLKILMLLAAAAAMSNAHAEKADRDKPVHLEADKVTVDDKQQLHVYEGNVVLTQGTLIIKSSRLHVKQDAEGYQRGIAISGAKGLAWFRQKREGRDDYVEGEAERIEHNNRTQITEFFNRAHVKSGLDEVSGQYIVFDSKTENYVVTNGPNGSHAPADSNQRVRAIIQPKNRSDAVTPPASLIPTPTLGKEPKQ